MKRINSDVAYDFIRKRILSGEYAPDQPLLTEQLSAEIGVSRTPVKEALLQLESDGLVNIRPRLGATVKRMDLKEFRDMCYVRLALETQAAGLAALYRDEGDLAEMQYSLESMQQLTERISGADQDETLLGELMRDDVRFHIAIMTAAKNDLMKKEILRLHLINRIASSRTVANGSEFAAISPADRDAGRRAVLKSHTEIFQAILRQDAKTAKLKMEEHIQEIIDLSMRLMGQNPSRNGPALRQLTADELAYTVT